MENLKEILLKSGFSFKKAYGQNFISDEGILNAIVAAADLTKADTVLEIGCGAGTLTKVLSGSAGRVVAYEIDESLRRVLSRTLDGCGNTEVKFCDIMKQSMSDIEGGLGEYVVVANLPYYITTPLIMRFIEQAKHVKRLVVMVQEEVAERLCALPGTAEYGSITAAIALVGGAKIVLRVPKTMFVPVPKVDSAVVRIDIGGGVEVKSRAIYRDVLRTAFGNRRKTLVNNLMSTFKMSREKAVELVTMCGAKADARGETLSAEQFAMIADMISEIKNEKTDGGKRQ